MWQIGIGDEEPAEGDGVADTSIERGLRPRCIEVGVQQQGPLERGANLGRQRINLADAEGAVQRGLAQFQMRDADRRQRLRGGDEQG